MHKHPIVAATIACFLLFFSCGGPLFDGDELTPEIRQGIVSTIDTMVHTHWPFEGYKDGVSLAVFSEKLTDSLTNTSERDFLRGVHRSIAYLEDGHTNLMVDRPSRIGVIPGIRIREIDGAFYVSQASASSGLLPGDEIIEINDVSPGERQEELLQFIAASTRESAKYYATRQLLFGQIGDTAEIRYMRNGDEETLEFTYAEYRPPRLEKPETRRFGSIGYLLKPTARFLSDIDLLDAALNKLMNTSGLIIDVRDNGGGVTTVIDYFAGRFFSSQPPRFTLRDKNMKIIRHIGAYPRGTTYTKPVVILTNPGSYSAANYLAHMLQFHGRATVIGETSGGGGASPRETVDLMHWLSFRVSTLVLYDPDTNHSESGITPDLTVAYTSEDLADGLDTGRGNPATDKALSEAIDWLEAL